MRELYDLSQPDRSPAQTRDRFPQDHLAGAGTQNANTGLGAMLHPEESNFCARAAALTGIPESLAQRAFDRGIRTLEDLELAAYDGRLETIRGFGKGRVAAIKETLDRYLSRHQRSLPLYPRPDVALLLALDSEYRRQAETGALPLIAPHRFNSGQHAWLPVWHVERAGWTFTVMYSNTALAYELGKRRDWVIVVYEHGGEDDHCTLVTEHQGPLQGRRVVRGREGECLRHYRNQGVAPDVRAWVHEMRTLI
jgi:DNA polymerase (family X)